MDSPHDTIVALATPPGRGGIGVIRVSGPASTQVALAMVGQLLRPRHAHYLPIFDHTGAQIDQGIILLFPGPNSFTGEDVLEIQAHGGPVVLDQITESILMLGTRSARAGEFSERAFLNGKIDLSQAEAVADLIDARSRQAAQSALRSLQGHFSKQVNLIIDSLIGLRIFVESAIDFPEEEIDFLADGEISARLFATQQLLNSLLQSAKQGNLLREGMHIVLAGRPNAGKSSLLNQLSGEDTAIVTEVAGTTRDLLKIEISIDGLPLHITDTAGLRLSSDRVEQEGIRRAWDAINKADQILLLIDEQFGIDAETQAIIEALPSDTDITIVHNKIDLVGASPQLLHDLHRTNIFLSAKTGDGVDLLRDFLKQSIGYEGEGEGCFMARRRHLDALAFAQSNLGTVAKLLSSGQGELVAEELRLTQERLGEITGRFTSDDLLGRIFTSFCIGK